MAVEPGADLVRRGGDPAVHQERIDELARRIAERDHPVERYTAIMTSILDALFAG